MLKNLSKLKIEKRLSKSFTLVSLLASVLTCSFLTILQPH